MNELFGRGSSRLWPAVALLGAWSCSDDGGGGAAAGGRGTGTVVVTLQDAPAEVEKVEVTISEVSVHYVANGEDDDDDDGDTDAAAAPDTDAGANDAGDADAAAPTLGTGWHSVFTDDKTYDLLTLAGAPTELGELNLGEGKITQIRLILSDGPQTVTVSGEKKEMKVPSNSVKIVGNFAVVEGQETRIALDFDVDASLTQKGNGEWQLKPTIKIVR